MKAIWLVVFIAIACGSPSSQPPAAGSGSLAPVSSPAPPALDYEALVRKLYADEPDYERRWPVEFHVRIAEGVLQDLGRAVLDRADLGAPFFADHVELGWIKPGNEQPQIDAITLTPYDALPLQVQPVATVRDDFRALFGSFQFFDLAIFKPKGAQMLADGGLEVTVGLDFGGHDRTGAWRHDSGVAQMVMHRLDGHWQITKLAVTSYATQRAPERGFREVTEAWLAGVSEPVRAMLRTRSASDEMHRMLLDDKHAPPASLDHLLPLAMDAHPGVVIVDIDRDGFDDLFVWDVTGTSVLLHNDGGAGFSDRTEQYGLALENVSAAAFADLDGDGQLDLVVGHWFEHSEILHSVGGRFWPGPAGRFALPAHVASISLADLDGDGKLDIFFATAAHDFHQHLAALLGGDTAVLAKLDPGERALLDEAVPAARAAQAAGKFDINIFQFGPRNVAMLNRGDGVFVDATEQLGLTSYRNSLEAAFGGLDGGGHPDLYVANDFAPANLYLWRAGRYVDVSSESGADQIYFGMGASLGDFDNDGDLDLYASAMQSTAGNRIMADDGNFSSEHDAAARVARKAAARGNTLLRNDGGGHFTDLTATAELAVARNTSWAYGAQFIDVDGDGYLDIFSPNGFFTSSISPDDPFVRDL